MFARNKVAMLVAEFLGTGVLTLVFLSVQYSNLGVSYFVALAAGLTVAALSLVFAGVSGAHLNPAVTIGLWTTRRVKTVAAATYIVAQLLGAWAAYGIYTYFVNQSLPTIGGHYTARLLIAEAIGAFVFAFVWAAVAAQRLAVTWIGGIFALAILIASVGHIGYVNPALALGARAWNIWGSMGWGTFVLGPVLGGVVGFNLYQLIFTDTYANVLPMRSSAATTSSRTAKKPASKKRK